VIIWGIYVYLNVTYTYIWQVDMDELREILTKLEDGKSPLPKDLLWCMAMGDQVPPVP